MEAPAERRRARRVGPRGTWRRRRDKDEDPKPETPGKDDDPAPSIEERIETLSEDLDDLEREAIPPKPKPAPVGGMF